MSTGPTTSASTPGRARTTPAQRVAAEPGDDGHKVARRQITIGTRRPGEVEVIDGLQQGELVITHGTMRVRPGQTVKIAAIDDGSRSLTELVGTGREADAAANRP